MSDKKVPIWLTILIVICSLPVVMLPYLLSQASAEGGIKTFLWIYPIYTIASAYLAYQSYANRREMTWILLIIMILTHLSIFLLVMSN